MVRSGAIGLVAATVCAAGLAMSANAGVMVVDAPHGAAALAGVSTPSGVPALLAQTRGDRTQALFDAIDRAAAKTPAPKEARRRLLASIVLSPQCYTPDLTPEELDQLVAETHLLPPGLLNRDRFNLTAVWTGNGNQGPSGQALPAQLTYSFPADGVLVGFAGRTGGVQGNQLNSRITTTFGAADLDEGREYIRQALGAWARSAGITYTEVADSGIQYDQVETRRAEVGDARIGAIPFGGSSTIAYNFFPDAPTAGTGGSDMTINLDFWTATQFENAANNYRWMRNLIAHEHGHGLGFIHQVPCTETKLMEPFFSTAFDVLTVDERRGAGSSYGDRLAPNQSAATATPIAIPNPGSVFLADLSLNGAAGPNNSDEDWFTFTVPATRSMSILAIPTGGTYTTGQQSSGCTGTTTSLTASSAGNINIELRDAAGTTVLQTASAAAAGSTETLTRTFTAGTYTVRVFDVGPNNSQTVQLYNLRFGPTTEPVGPTAHAGINKRVNINQNCFFMGDINTTRGDSTTLNYAWDTDGNGTFETAGAKPVVTYTTPGVRSVVLRVTDGNNLVDTDTIQVTVAAPVVASITPPSGNAGLTIPVTINGTDLQGASTVSVSGTGVTVTGTPAVNATGTQITGLSFVIAPGATLGARNVTITATAGTWTSNTVFTVTTPAPANDLCANAITVTSGSTTAGTLVGAGNDGAGLGDCGTAEASPDVWYAFTAPSCGGVLTANTCGTHDSPAANAGIDTVVSIVSACGGTQLACSDDTATGICPGAVSPFRDSLAVATLTPGQTVRIRVANFNNGATGPFTLNVNFAIPNDACAGAIAVAAGSSTSFCTTGTTTDGPTETACTFLNGTVQNDLWYTYTPVGNGRFTVNTCTSGFDTTLAVYAGACPAAPNTALTCNDDACGAGGTRSIAQVIGVAGTTYRIRVGGFNGATGTGALNVFCAADFNQSGAVTVQDIFDFLAGYFGGSPNADINGAAGITVQDIFDFLATYFGGC